MCIIAVKLAETKLDKKAEKILSNSVENNSDGVGYCYRDGKGKIVIRKGFFEFDELMSSLDKQRELNPNNTEILFHSRIRTHGSISPACTQPFPNSSSEKQLKLLSVKTKLPVVAHNGIISGQENHATMSDTMMFIKNYLSTLNHVLKFKSVRKMLAFAISSKLTIMTLDETYYLGEFIEDAGWIFSNDSYKPREVPTYGYNLGKGFKFNKGKSTKVYNQNSYNYSRYNPVTEPETTLYNQWDHCDWCGNLVPGNDLKLDPTIDNPQSDGTFWSACKDCLKESMLEKSKKTINNSLLDPNQRKLYNGEDWH